MTASFLLFSIVIGLIARMKEGVLTETFVDGARDLLGVALIIGIARGITVIMNNGEITDTVLHWAEVALGDVGQAAFSIVMYTLFLPLSLPDPLVVQARDRGDADHGAAGQVRGRSEGLVVTAYQTANGLMNLFIPTSAVVMGGLAIARVPYGRYLRWVWPLLAMLAVLTVIVLAGGARPCLSRLRDADRRASLGALPLASSACSCSWRCSLRRARRRPVTGSRSTAVGERHPHRAPDANRRRRRAHRHSDPGPPQADDPSRPKNPHPPRSRARSRSRPRATDRTDGDADGRVRETVEAKADPGDHRVHPASA